MKDEINSHIMENREDRNTIDVPTNQSKFISKRKRKEYINSDSDKEEEQETNIVQKPSIENEESKENENTKNLNDNIKQKYGGNKYNTIDRNQSDNLPTKNNTALQEKLKKIFMNRDKVKFQYAKQEIPDNLKYHSDESELSENDELRKSKKSKNKNNSISSQKKENRDIKYSNQKESIKSSNRRQFSDIKISNNKLKKTDLDENNISDFANEAQKSGKKDENIKYNYSNQKRKFSNYNEEEKTKSSKKSSANKYEKSNRQYKYSTGNPNNNTKSNKKNKEEYEDNIGNKKNDNFKKNILLNIFQKMDKKEELSEKENNDIDSNINNNEKLEKNDEKLDKKQKLLKLLIQKKNSNETEEQENNYNKDLNDIENDNNIESPIKEKEERRQKIINDIKLASNKKEEKEPSKEENIERDDYNDKGTYISNNIKDKLTISIKPQKKLVNQISSSSFEEKEKSEEKEKGKEENIENPNKTKKANALINILKKLQKKKSEEQEEDNYNNEEININKNINNNNNQNDIDINESEIEREAEKIRKKEKKKQERKLAKEKEKEKQKNNKYRNEQEQDDDSNTFNSLSYNKTNQDDNNKDNEINQEELKRRKKLKEDLRAELNDINKEDASTVNNSSKSNLISSSAQLTNFENEEKTRKKDTNIKPTHKKLASTRNNMIIDQSAAPNEIIINGMPKNNLDRSFDNSNGTYMKRRIPTGHNHMNVYKAKKPDIRGRSQEKMEYIGNNQSNIGISQINNIINNNGNFLRHKNIGNKIPNRQAYRKKSTTYNENNNFVQNNHSFCEYQIDNNQDDENMNIEMEMDMGGGLNSSFDAYMQMQVNNNNNFGNNFMNRNNQGKSNIFFGTAAKNFNNRRFNRITQSPNNNINYMDGYSNNYGQRLNNNYNNEEFNRSIGYINSNTNNIFKNNEINYNNNINNEYNQKTNYINKSFINNNNNNQLYNKQRQNQFISYNNSNPNATFYNSGSPRQYIAPNSPSIAHSNFNNKYYANSPSNMQRFTPNKNKELNSNFIETPRNQRYEKNTSINIEDLMVLEEKLYEIIIALNKSHCMHNECFEFWNYYYNCSFYGKLETLFKTEDDQINIQLSINHMLISVMICYDFSFEISVLNNEFSILIDILTYNHRNLIIIYEHILSKISSESMSNVWVYKLKKIVNNFKQLDNSDYISNDGREFNPVEKIMYNVSIIVQNIRLLLKNYKTQRIEHLTNIFKKISEKSYEDINSFFRDNILRVDNVKGSVLASVFLKENQYFKTEPAPYIKTKNRKPYSLILDLDETLVHFKVNNEDDSEGVLQIRPGVMPFLELVGKYYELIIFTAATQDYGDLLIDAIEENNVFFEHRFYRQHTVIMGNDFIKDLTRVGRPLDKIIIVDNMPQNFRLQKRNGINIKAFWGEDVDDNALDELGKILVNIAKDGGDVRIGLEKYRDEIVKKVTSNISRNNY